MVNESTTLLERNYKKIPFKICKSKHIIINGKVNGVPARFILDTGASNSCISTEDEIEYNITATISGHTATGAGKGGIETKIAKDNTLSLSQWKKSKVTFISLDLSHVNLALVTHNVAPIDGIIGADILITHKALIDYEKRYLYLLQK
ncbi:retroviral-like aspartic protease family protein [Flavobacterium agricola]|uniref:Retroviral-like aspartic protease family protein n=1 Tax=Flavobacterium agricola TaxID=2870839 RepID=A0ABY6LY35_9FLAO|nr:retropepsin-like aspartic protease [Flavobacterium agricola]UYW01248.1 retroviral-like aspartic protease family protein [Flavobacterium agricola]